MVNEPINPLVCLDESGAGGFISHENHQRALENAAKNAMLIEREECAKVLDEMADYAEKELEPSDAVDYIKERAAFIRAGRVSIDQKA